MWKLFHVLISVMNNNMILILHYESPELCNDHNYTKSVFKRSARL